MEKKIPQQVQAGDQISARLLNSLIAGVNASTAVRGDGPLKFTNTQQIFAKCENVSNVTIERGECVRIYEGRFDPSKRDQAAFNMQNLQGDSDYVAGVLGIAMQPAITQTLANVCFGGICSAKLRHGETYTPGDRLDATTNPASYGQVLELAAFGPAKLLSLDETIEGETWGFVLLNDSVADLQSGILTAPDPLPDPLPPVTRANAGPHTVTISDSTVTIEANSDLCTGVLFYGDEVMVATVAGVKQIITPGRQVLAHCKIVDTTGSTNSCGKALWNVHVNYFCDTPPDYGVVAYDPVSDQSFTEDQEVVLHVDPGLPGSGTVTYSIARWGCPPAVEETP